MSEDRPKYEVDQSAAPKRQVTMAEIVRALARIEAAGLAEDAGLLRDFIEQNQPVGKDDIGGETN